MPAPPSRVGGTVGAGAGRPSTFSQRAIAGAYIPKSVYSIRVASFVAFSGGRPLVRGRPIIASDADGVGSSSRATSCRFAPYPVEDAVAFVACGVGRSPPVASSPFSTRIARSVTCMRPGFLRRCASGELPEGCATGVGSICTAWDRLIPVPAWWCPALWSDAVGVGIRAPGARSDPRDSPSVPRPAASPVSASPRSCQGSPAGWPVRKNRSRW